MTFRTDSIARLRVIRGVLILVCSLAGSASLADNKIHFNRDIRPILSENCFACHGPDAATQEQT